MSTLPAKSKAKTDTQISLASSAQNDTFEKTPLVIGFPIFVVVVGALIYAGFWIQDWLQDEQRLPVQEIVFSGDMKVIDTIALTEIIRKDSIGSFFALNVDQVHGLMESQAWVLSASVRKRWPSKLYIHIVEQKAVAIWNDDLLLNRHGDTFDGLKKLPHVDPEKQYQTKQNLPHIFGPGGSEKTALIGYNHMQQLLSASGLKIAQIVLSERFAWQIKLNNQIVVKLGRQEYVNRLQRFIDVYPLLMQETKPVKYVDLRYDTGLAVGWGEIVDADKLSRVADDQQHQENQNHKYYIKRMVKQSV